MEGYIDNCLPEEISMSVRNLVECHMTVQKPILDLFLLLFFEK